MLSEILIDNLKNLDDYNLMGRLKFNDKNQEDMLKLYTQLVI